MRLNSKIILSTTFALLPGLVQASDEGVQPFLGLKGGFQYAADDAYEHNDPHDPIAGVFGGLQFTEAWSWDLGYQYHDELTAKATSVDVKTWLIESALRYDWYVLDDVSLYGRLGAAYWDMDKSSASQGDLGATGFSPLGEVGVNYRVLPSVRLSAGYQYIDAIGGSKTGKYDSHALMLSVSYVFGQSKQAELEPVVELPPVVEAPIEVAPKPIYVRSLFAHDSSEITPSAEGKLTGVADTLRSNPEAEIDIVGHTDSTGSEEYNQALSERRAQSVADKLQEYQVAADKMRVSGQGESEPVSTNDTAEGRAENRRVELTITTPESEAQ